MSQVHEDCLAHDLKCTHTSSSSLITLCNIASYITCKHYIVTRTVQLKSTFSLLMLCSQFQFCVAHATFQQFVHNSSTINTRLSGANYFLLHICLLLGTRFLVAADCLNTPCPQKSKPLCCSADE